MIRQNRFQGQIAVDGKIATAFYLLKYNIDIIATILQVALWYVDSAPALKYISYKLESWLAGHLEKGSVH